MIDGIEVKLGEKSYIVPPLNFKALKTIQPIIDRIGNMKASKLTISQMDDVIAVIHAAIQRNYPEVTVGYLEEVVDLGNAGKLLMSIMGASGFTEAGEAKPVSQ